MNAIQISLAAAGGVIGSLEKLDTKSPVLYVDTPKGRIRMSGSIVYPKTKYMTFALMRDHVLCEDVFDSLLVFSSWAWIGTKEENPQERELPMPPDLAAALPPRPDAKFGDGAPRRPDGTAATPERVTIDLVEDTPEPASVERGRARARPARRSAAKRKTYAESASDGGDEEEDEEDEGEEASGDGRAEGEARATTPRRRGAIGAGEVIVIEDTPPRSAQRKRPKR